MPKLDNSVKDVYNKIINSLGVSKIRLFNDKFSKIPGIIKLTLGEPDFNVSEHVKEAAIRSIQENKSHYSEQKGIPELRDAISKYLKTRQGLDYDPESEIVVTIGATEAIFSSMGAILNPGDKVIVPTPTFALYMPIIEVLGGIPIQVDMSEDGFRLTGKKLEEVLAKEGEDSVKAILMNFPGNPTGYEYTESDLQEIVDVVKDKKIYVVSDEIYSEITYGQEHVSLAKLMPGKTVVINGLSKSHAMTGYRIGYIAAPKDFITNASKMHAYTVTAPSNPAQYAAVEALTVGIDDAKAMRDVYQERRDFVVSRLNELGYETQVPEGAFYSFSRIPSEYGMDDVEFAEKLANEAKVGVTPGSAFGKGGENHFRISYASSIEDLTEAMNRIEKFTANL
ncbi:aminotransferase class I/II-fold pyridoxal phosphate-dependent enzyme [Companilactobacillus metriopterae]|uniref:aminotransferase class I/II-fold pyridoxal phosphate-dependent enzyme n=1 Tax=Companilactobacillus metriopterae TaxID=1909267 RepID=UPI00100AF0A1|nr:aminotransferase class I/II-fold pyridoxal phosphate-dependent enzyme [Companilactobacillus metriopterae]